MKKSLIYRPLLILIALLSTGCLLSDVSSLLSGAEKSPSPTQPGFCDTPEAQGSFPFANSSTATGTAGDEFIICTAPQFQELGNNTTHWDKHFKLEADIDLLGLGVNPIGNSVTFYSGSFFGNRHTISNVTINQPGANHIAVFGKIAVGGNVQDLKIENANITGLGQVGTLAGVNLGTVARVGIKDSTINFDFSGMNKIGGFIGFNSGTITDSYTKNISITLGSTNTDTAGFVGDQSGTILNSYASGTISNAGAAVMGFANNSAGAINNSFVAVVINNGVANQRAVSNTGPTNLFADFTLSCNSCATIGVVDKVNSELRDPQSTVHTTQLGWDFANIWKEVPGEFPELR